MVLFGLYLGPVGPYRSYAGQTMSEGGAEKSLEKGSKSPNYESHVSTEKSSPLALIRGSGGAVTRHACPRPFKTVRWHLEHAVRSPFSPEEIDCRRAALLSNLRLSCSARVLCLCRASRHAPCQASLNPTRKDGAGTKGASLRGDSSSILVEQYSI